MNLIVLEERRETCGVCSNMIEFNADQTAVLCRARNTDGKRKCASCWAKLDATDKTFGCTVPGRWTYDSPSSAPPAVPAEPPMRFPLEFNSQAMKENVCACRGTTLNRYG